MIDRRDFIRVGGMALAGLWSDGLVGNDILAQRVTSRVVPLIDEVQVVCRRLARHGWADLILSVTGGQLDLTAPNLARELAKNLSAIKRESAGFEDFAAEGHRGIEPGVPSSSLLFHALASPAVVQGAGGKPLTDFPTPTELEVIENYVYGVTPPTLAELRGRVNGAYPARFGA